MRADSDRQPTRGERTEQGDETRERILAAATAQFKEKGLAGARVDEIAKAAGCNKQLIYYYFGDKAGLYEESLKRMVGVSNDMQAGWDESMLGPNPLLQWLRDNAESAKDPDRDWHRVWLWEAIAWPAEEVTLHEERRAVWQGFLRRVQAAQKEGLIRSDLDPAMVAMATLGVAAFPHMFPQLTELICERLPDDPRFTRQQDKFFRQLAAALAPDEA
jgi:TetR/AcrR family transcriptional regulator